MEVQGKSFVIDPDAVPDADVELGVTDPDEQDKYYREAGLDAIVQNLRPIQLAETAARAYQEIPAADYQLYSGYMSNRVGLAECIVPPPAAAVSILVSARRAKLFDNIEVLSNPDNGESLLVGLIRFGQNVRRFGLYQWSTTKLTTIEQLRKQQRFSRAIGRALKSILEWRPNIHLDLKPRRKGQPHKWLQVIMFSLLIAAAAVSCWYVLYKWDTAWGMLGAMVTLALACWFLVPEIRNNDVEDIVEKASIGIVVLNLIAGIVMGFVHWSVWNTTPRTEDVLVCRAFATHIGSDDQAYTDWRVATNTGNKTVEPGFYDGVYYSGSSEKAARSLVGKWVHITEHGHIGASGNPPYITAATTLRDGNGTCGK